MNRASIAALVFALTTAVWLNQSVGGKDWEALRDRTFAAPSEHVVDYVRYPFVFLYRRAHDEEIYFATASAILGRAFDADFADRGDVPAEYSRMPPADGRFHAPYTEVPFEYPPLALPFIVAPRLLTSTYATYTHLFGALMAACLFAACAILIRHAPEDRRAKLWWMATALVLAHGAIAIQRLDAVVALLLALAVDAALKKKHAMIGVWLGLAAAAKLSPILLLPIAFAADFATYRAAPKKAAAMIGATAASTALGLAPMAIASPSGMVAMIAYHAKRGLHVESVLGSLYGAARAIGGSPIRATLDFGSHNLHDAIADTLARLSPPLTIAVVAFVAWRAWRDRLAFAAAIVAGAAATWIASKVLSPQYFTWALPLVLAIPKNHRAYAALFAAMLVSQIYFRGYFDYVYEQRALGVATLLVRQAAIFALFVFSLRHIPSTQDHKP
jgi:hypothetical protein